MALDPQAKSVIEHFTKAKLPAYSAVGAVEARRIYRESRAPLESAEARARRGRRPRDRRAARRHSASPLPPARRQ